MAFEELKENPKKYIKGLAMDLIVVLVAIAYVLYQMVSLEVSVANPLILIAEAFMGIICGVTIKQALGENGFSKGYNSVVWQEEEEKYNNACNTANPYMERVENFYFCQEIEKRRNYRRQNLQAARMKYSEWFDKNGYYIGTQENYDKLDRRQKWVLRKCTRVKIYVLNLFSEYAIGTEQDTKKEMTDKRQRTRNATKNTLSATIIAAIGVYFVPMFDKWSWANLISSTMQVSLWIIFGILQLYTNYNYVVKDKVAILRKKKELISRFISDCNKGMYVYNPYDLIESEGTKEIEYKQYELLEKGAN